MQTNPLREELLVLKKVPGKERWQVDMSKLPIGLTGQTLALMKCQRYEMSNNMH
jgi:hypothetical protein